ncbi:MAG: branched-chain amino acid ABC transporter permease/ATP-binding protein [Actinomycetota bacterium]|nr:branched-chain amino acid ABC transporter permease/ATP-binding protein [Actinomycetota bacterium]
MSDLPAVALLGTASGLQVGLLAVGLVLVFRANRFINLAQGQMGAVASCALAVLVFRFDAPYWIALPAALVLGAATGALVERLLMWRLFQASRLALLVATIGISQLILLLVLAGPLKPDAQRLAMEGYPQPFDTRWEVGSAVVTSSQLLTILVAPAIAIGLAVLLNRTRTGRAIRGAASNPDAARLSGISVRRTSLLVWTLAGFVSSVGAILYAPTQPAVGFSDSGPGLLLRGLAAALLAGLVDVRVAVVAGVGIGILEQATVFYTDVPGLADVVLALALAAGLLLRWRTLAGASRGEDGLVVERSVETLPEAARRRVVVRESGRLGWAVLLGLVAIAPLLPGLGTQERAVFLVFMVAFAITGLGISVLTGWAGQVTLGSFAFLGVGAYTATLVDELGIPVMLLASGAAAAVASTFVGSVALRSRGLLMGVVTLAFAFAARSWLFRQGLFTEDASAIVNVDEPHLFGLRIATVRGLYPIAVAVLVLSVVALRSVRRSSVGRAIVASRDNPALASAHGLPPLRARLTALAVSGFVTGMAGALWAMASGSFTFSAFDPSMSFVLLSVAIVGGLGTLHGPILGTIAVFGWPYLVSGANTLPIRSFTSGALLLLTLLFVPGGLAALLDRGRRLLVGRLGPAGSASAAGAADDAPDPVPVPTLPSSTVDDRAPAAAESLVASGVTVRFGGIAALTDVDVEVRRGEIVGLIGANGAGKSTLLDVLSGHLQPAAGVIHLAGTDVSSTRPEIRSLRQLSRTFQDARLYPGLTVRETVMAAADARLPGGAVSAMTASPWLRMAERDKLERADAVLAQLGLTEQAGTLVGELSTGMRRVCDLAAIVAAAPAIVLLDEPTAGLAQREVEAFAPLLRDLRDRVGASVLVVEHDMALMMSLCDRIYCLESGRVIAEGSPDEVRADPRVVASYLGTDPAAVERSGTGGPGPARRAKART